jgi:hypothetical protein
MELEVDCELHPGEPRPSAELTIYRLVQEALTNIAKYAKASRVQVKVGSRDGKVEVCVRDNGIGFDPRHRHLATHGLLGMQFRVESESGEMTIESAPGCGTSIFAALPEAKPMQAPVETGEHVRRGLNNDRANRPARLSASSYGPLPESPDNPAATRPIPATMPRFHTSASRRAGSGDAT